MQLVTLLWIMANMIITNRQPFRCPIPIFLPVFFIYFISFYNTDWLNTAVAAGVLSGCSETQSAPINPSKSVYSVQTQQDHRVDFLNYRGQTRKEKKEKRGALAPGGAGLAPWKAPWCLSLYLFSVLAIYPLIKVQGFHDKTLSLSLSLYRNILQIKNVTKE